MKIRAVGKAVNGESKIGAAHDTGLTIQHAALVSIQIPKCQRKHPPYPPAPPHLEELPPFD